MLLNVASLVALAVTVSISGTAHAAASPSLFHTPGLSPRLHNSQSVNLWKLHRAARSESTVSTTTASHDTTPRDSRLLVQGGDGLGLDYGVQGDVERRATTATFPQYNFTQPLDHFYGTTNGTFPQRYWVRPPLPLPLLPSFTLSVCSIAC